MATSMAVGAGAGTGRDDDVEGGVNLALSDAPNAAIRGDLRHLKPEHLQLISLRLAGHSWTKCALHLGVDRETVRRWRIEFPEIERQLSEESEYALVLAREDLPGAVQDAVRRCRRIVNDPTAQHSDAIAASKLLTDIVTRQAGKDDPKEPPPNDRARARVAIDATPRELRAELRQRLGRR
jgi:transposase-like protein